MTRVISTLKDVNIRASHRKFQNRVNTSKTIVVLIWIPLVSMVFFIIGGPKSISLLLLSSLLSFIVLPKNYVDRELVKHKFINAWIIIFNVLFYILPPFHEIGSINPMSFIAFYIYCIMTSLSLSYTIDNLKWDEYVRWSMVVFFLCPLALWGLIFMRQFSAAAYAYELMGGIGNPVQIREQSLFGIFNYGNVAYAISYFTLAGISVWCVPFLTKNNREKIILLMLVLIGLYSSSQFFKRSPLVYGFLGGLLVLMYYFVKSRKIVLNKLRFLVNISFVMIGLLLLFNFLVIIMFPNYFIFINVLSEIPNDIRMSIWSESVNLFFADPFSAFRSKLCISYYSHNIMLDYAADYGIFGFIFACILIVYLIFRIIRILYTTSNLVGLTSLILLCLAVSHFMIIFSEPPLSQRMIILLLSCLTFININDTGYRKSRRKRTSIFGIVGMDAQGRTRFKAGSRRH